MEEDLKDSGGEPILATIRTKYLQARAPQQIRELVTLFQPEEDGYNWETKNVNSGETMAVGKKTFSLQNSDLAILEKLHRMNVGFSPEGKNVDEETSGGDNSSLFHPPVQYRIAFTKFIIKQMECLASRKCDNKDVPQDDAEKIKILLEDWYDILEKLLSTEQVSEPFYRLYEIGSHPFSNNQGDRAKHKDIVKIFENETSFVADGTTGLVTWKAAIEFVNWLTREELRKDQGGFLEEAIKSFESCKWILELGCGCGFLAVAVNKLLHSSLKKYIATDCSLAALEKAKENVEANFSCKRNEDDIAAKSRISFERVDWENESTIESFSQLVDGMTGIYGTDSGVLLGTDIIFDPAQVPALVELIHDFLDKRSGIVLMSCTVRNPETMNSFRSEIVRKGLKPNVCSKWEDGEIMLITQT